MWTQTYVSPMRNFNSTTNVYNNAKYYNFNMITYKLWKKKIRQ